MTASATHIDRLAGWRDEITAELAIAQQDVAEASAALETALEARNAAQAEYRDAHQVLGPLAARGRLAVALSGRIDEHKQELEQIEHKEIGARHALAEARRRIADLEKALEQLAEVLPAPPAEDAA